MGQHTDTMADKHPKRPRDPNQLGKAIIDIVTGRNADRPEDDPQDEGTRSQEEKPQRPIERNQSSS